MVMVKQVTYTKHGTGSMDPVRGPLHGPGPWTTLNFQKEIAPVDMKIYRRSGYEKHRLVLFAYVLEGLSRKSGLLWDRAPILKWEDHKLVLRYRRSSESGYPQYFRSNTFKLQFDRELPPPPFIVLYRA